MRPQEKTVILRSKCLAVLVFILSVAFLFAPGSAILLVAAQVVSQEPPIQPPAQWKEMEDRVPKHLPIKIKVKNLQNEHWMRDLEIEVTNKATKPIYYLKISVSMPDLKVGGWPVGYMLRYGRPELIEFDKPILPEDVPIKPGETITLKLTEIEWRGWDEYSAKHNLPKSGPKMVRIMFHILNFGDGTGFSGTMGTPIPNPRVISYLQEQKNRVNILASTKLLSGFFPDLSLQQLAFPLPLVLFTSVD